MFGKFLTENLQFPVIRNTFVPVIPVPCISRFGARCKIWRVSNQKHVLHSEGMVKFQKSVRIGEVERSFRSLNPLPGISGTEQFCSTQGSGGGLDFLVIPAPALLAQIVPQNKLGIIHVIRTGRLHINKAGSSITPAPETIAGCQLNRGTPDTAIILRGPGKRPEYTGAGKKFKITLIPQLSAAVVPQQNPD